MALSLRDNRDAAQLKLAALHIDHADQVRRLLTFPAIYDIVSRAQASRTSGVTRQIVRDWVEPLNDGGANALIVRKAPGKPPLLNPAQRAALAQMIEDQPLPAIDVVVRWRLIDLAQ